MTTSEEDRDIKRKKQCWVKNGISVGFVLVVVVEN
jgi:hypothetical protein